MDMRKKILVVEDEPTLRNLFVIRLEEYPYQIFDAGEGKVALDLCEQNKPDIILLDINLPDILGVDIVDEINENHDKFGHPKIIVLTGISYSIGDAKERWLKIDGVVDYFSKPFDFDELIERIQEVLK